MSHQQAVSQTESAESLVSETISTDVSESINDSVTEVYDTVVPVWPLKDYVAVNPYFGIADRSFIQARDFMRVFSDCEMLMPVEYYAQQFHDKKFGVEHIKSALSELSASGVSLQLKPEQIKAKLDATGSVGTTLDQPAPAPNPDRQIRTIAELCQANPHVNWTETFRNEISKYCATHYDDGQASWTNPWKHLSLYSDWRTAVQHDFNMESLGLTGFHDYINQLPESPEESVQFSLEQLDIPRPLWTTFLLCQAYSIPGWSAWAKYQDAETDATDGTDFVGLLAMRLSYDVALSKEYTVDVNWDQYVQDDRARFPKPLSESNGDAVLRYALLRASEIGYRDNLLNSLSNPDGEQTETDRKLAQMVFCIDVRSERIRRQIETVTNDVETFGFAGFFGMPIEVMALGEKEGVIQLPVLLKPQFQVHEGLHHDCSHHECSHDEHRAAEPSEHQAVKTRVGLRTWRKLWKGFQTSAVGCFSFVETTGLFFGFKLLGRALGFKPLAVKSQHDGVAKSDIDELGPTLKHLVEQGIDTEQQVNIVEGALRNLGITNDFARLVVFCGHVSETDNNPLAAGLDCGACAGHSGAPNARFAAMLLNRPEIRASLRTRGIEIPEDTHFIGAVHNTTIDHIEFFDVDDVPATHKSDLLQLAQTTKSAGQQTGTERLPIVAGDSLGDLTRRSSDWSEVRPEWGLAGNAAFIVAPRSITKDANLDGRAFMHSYNHNNDPEGTVLETIMTAPMVVANWINMQYYASTVDNHHFGSGNKTLHNVVGRFGILSGNSGDLMTGLPWQSLHTGDHYQHLPLRLQVVIAAPRTSISRIIDKHELVAQLIMNDWLHLVALEDGQKFRYTSSGDWELVETIASTMGD